ncbi:MAG: hypothetical protein ACE5DX_05340 [Candidatus Dojkabacteria bacterium]
MEIIPHQYKALPPERNTFYLQRPVRKDTDIVLALERQGCPEVWEEIEVGVRFGCSYLSGGRITFKPWQIIEIARKATQCPDQAIADTLGVTRIKVRTCRKAVDRAAIMVQNNGIVTPELVPVLSSEERRVYDLYRGHIGLHDLLEREKDLKLELSRQPHLNWLLGAMRQGWHVGDIADYYGLGMADDEKHNVSTQLQDTLVWKRSTRIPHKFLQRLVFSNYLRSKTNWGQQYVDGFPFSVAKQVLPLVGDNFWIELRRFFALLYDREQQVNPQTYTGQFDFINQSSSNFEIPTSLKQILTHVVACKPIDRLLDVHSHVGYSRNALRSAYSAGLRFMENVLLIHGYADYETQAKRQRSRELKEWSEMLNTYPIVREDQ